MDSPALQSNPTDDPAHAFEALRGEVSLLRRAVEGLTAERQNAPDYTPTLNATAKRLGEIGAFMQAISDMPAMTLTPDKLAAEIFKASISARTDDHKLIDGVSASISASIDRIDAVVERAWTAERQWRQLLWTAAVAFSLGAVFWAIVPQLLSTVAGRKQSRNQPSVSQTHENQLVKVPSISRKKISSEALTRFPRPVFQVIDLER